MFKSISFIGSQRFIGIDVEIVDQSNNNEIQ